MSIVETFGFTNSEQTFTVPSGVTTINAKLLGGAGSLPVPNPTGPQTAGIGGYLEVSMNVIPYTTLYLYVGGKANDNVSGFNGGGNGGYYNQSGIVLGGGGGGGTDIRTISGGDLTSLNSRLVVAGGGGGRGYNMGGGGRGGNSTNSGIGVNGGGGTGGGATRGYGGTDTQGGVGGNYNGDYIGSSGGFGFGGDGYLIQSGAGGGGGGYYGGGGGGGDSSNGSGGGGGGGGSSYWGGTGVTLVSNSTWAPTATGNGIIILEYTIPPPIVCFKEGSKILTDKGYIPIQDLRKGDLVKTLRHDYKAIDMIGKRDIYHIGCKERIKDQLYKCSQEQYPEVFEDLVITGCHSILVDNFKDEQQRDGIIRVNGDLYATDYKCRLPACVDDRTSVYEKPGNYTIYHLALENDDYYMNYGIYANGLLVETCSKRYLKELSNMELIE